MKKAKLLELLERLVAPGRIPEKGRKRVGKAIQNLGSNTM
jgi:hypothetical protein